MDIDYIMAVLRNGNTVDNCDVEGLIEAFRTAEQERDQLLAQLEAAETERQCLAEAIGRIATASGDTRTEFTGPDLLLVCGDAAEGIKHLLAENARLQSVIDAANAQEPVDYERLLNGEWVKCSKTRYEVTSDPVRALYARPIPAQQSPVIGVPDECCATGQSCDYEICTLNGGRQCKYCGKKHTDMQSPAVAVPDGFKLVPIVLTDEMVEAFNVAEDSFQDGRGTAPDCHWAAMISAAPLPPVATSPRITEQDAREILEDYLGYCDGKKLKPESTVVVGIYIKKQISELLATLNRKPQ